MHVLFAYKFNQTQSKVLEEQGNSQHDSGSVLHSLVGKEEREEMDRSSAMHFTPLPLIPPTTITI